MKPLIEDSPTRGLIEKTVNGITAALEHREPSTASEIADHAVLRKYVANDGGKLLAQAIHKFNGSPALGLFGGAARIGWTVAHLTDERTASDACDRLDKMLAHALEGWIGDYDLTSGLVGFGIYALERGAAGRPLALRVLDLLERSATGNGHGIAWHTAPELLSRKHLDVAPDGYWNLGLAHGVPGVIALLARYVVAGVDERRAFALLEGAVRYVVAAGAPASSHEGRYPTWQPNHKPISTRLAWCYGDLGVAAALLGAATLLEHAKWKADALELAQACAARTVAQAHVHDACLCHGAAGIAHVFHRMARATGDEALGNAARNWIVETLRMRSDGALGGFPRVYEAGGELQFAEDATLLTGCVGVALALHAAVSEVEPRWDRLLLVDLPVAA